MVVAAFVLLSTTPWTDLADIGEFFVVPISAITDTQQKLEVETTSRTLRQPSSRCLDGSLTHHNIPQEWAVLFCRKV